MNTNRIYWIDALKGLGIFFVTFGHLNPWLPIEKYIYSFHMFLFFFISGYLYKGDSPPPVFLSKVTKRVLLPFIIWDCISILVGIVSGVSITQSARQLLVIDGELCFDRPIWFLLVLYITEVIYEELTRIKSNIWVSVAISIIGMAIWLSIGKENLHLKLNLVPIAISFFSFGDIFKKILSKYKVNKRQTIIVIISSFILNFIFGTILNDRISFTGGYWGNPLYCLIAAYSGVVFYVLLFMNFPFVNKQNVLCDIGKNSMFIMVIQYFFFQFASIITSKLFNYNIWTEESTLKALCFSIVTLCVAMISSKLACLMLKKFKYRKIVLNCLGISEKY